MSQWLRRKADNVIYGWIEGLARRTDEFELVSEEEAFPEKFLPKNTDTKDTGLSEKLASVEAAPNKNKDAALSKDAAKGLRARGL